MTFGFMLIAVAVVAVVLVGVVLVARSRRANDGVDSFRRQIDALSPEARRPVVDQVQNAADRHHRDVPTVDPDADASDDDDTDLDDSGDTDGDGGVRGA